MFNRRLAILIIVCLVCVVLTWQNWKTSQGVALPSSQGVGRAFEWRQDLTGNWQCFDSLRSAWNAMQGNQPLDGALIARYDSLYLPSSTSFKVAARRFTLPSEWSSRDMLLTFKGVKGQAAVYLNGIDPVNRLAVFDGNGGDYHVLIPPTAFKYGENNVLLVEMSPGSHRQNTFGGWKWPQTGAITGSIYIDAVIEHLEEPQIVVELTEDNRALVKVHTALNRSLPSERREWTVEGIVSDGSMEVARAAGRMEDAGAARQEVVLEFALEDVQLWSVDHPFLYHLLLIMTSDKGDVDRLSMTFGIRHVRFAQGFYLNQERLPVQGVFLSPDAEAKLRNAGEIREWLSAMKAQGYNLIYFSGFPDELWLEIADRLGVGVWVEWPVYFVAGPHLPDAEVFRNLVDTGSRHPSLWGWTVGKGLGPLPSPHLASYWRKSLEILNGAPAFIVEPYGGSDGSGGITLGTEIPGDRIIVVQDGVVRETWGEIRPYVDEQAAAAGRAWGASERLAQGLAVWSVVVLLQNIRSRHWGYRDLLADRPKRPLRHSWRWHSIHFWTRETVWAGMLTALLFETDLEKWRYWVGIWPLWDQILIQSPWLVWLDLTVLFVMLRVMQVGVAAPFFPHSPSPLGLICWMERRYRWFVLVAVLWAAAPALGIPLAVVPLSYIGFNLLFAPLRIRDVRRIRGRYRSLLLVPALVAVIPLGWGIWRWPDLVYLWEWTKLILKGFDWKIF